jgi:hypothetical protein
MTRSPSLFLQGLVAQMMGTKKNNYPFPLEKHAFISFISKDPCWVLVPNNGCQNTLQKLGQAFTNVWKLVFKDVGYHIKTLSHQSNFTHIN